MTEILIFAGVLVVVVGAITAPWVMARNAERATGLATAQAVKANAEAEAATKERDRETARANDEKARADALDDAIVDHVAAGPVDGAFERLLQKRAAAKPAARGGSAGPVPPPSTTEPGPDDLLKPGA